MLDKAQIEKLINTKEKGDLRCCIVDRKAINTECGIFSSSGGKREKKIYRAFFPLRGRTNLLPLPLIALFQVSIMALYLLLKKIGPG